MAKISREEFLKIAELSALTLDESEIESLHADLSSVVEYTDQLSSVTLGTERKPARNINLFRDDVARTPDSRDILEQAPERSENYFVVPKIID